MGATPWRFESSLRHHFFAGPSPILGPVFCCPAAKPVRLPAPCPTARTCHKSLTRSTHRYFPHLCALFFCDCAFFKPGTRSAMSGPSGGKTALGFYLHGTLNGASHWLYRALTKKCRCPILVSLLRVFHPFPGPPQSAVSGDRIQPYFSPPTWGSAGLPPLFKKPTYPSS